MQSPTYPFTNLPTLLYTHRSSNVGFCRCRRVAQRLERLLDTQEVGGSSPPVPTTLRSLEMSQVTVTLPDGSSRVMPAGTLAGEVATSISPRLGKAALAALVDGR